MTTPPWLAVARFAKPHGLHGEAVMYVLTDQPEAVFVPGQVLTPVDDDGVPRGAGFTIERARPYHRRWLLKFAGVADRAAVERWGDMTFGVPADALVPPAEGEMYVHEVPGVTVVAGGEVVGTARELLQVPSGRLLAVEREDGRELLVPFKRPIVVRVDRPGRLIEIDPPPGLLDL